MSVQLGDYPEIIKYRTRDGRVYVICNGICRSVFDGTAEVESHPFLGLRLSGGVAANTPSAPASARVTKGDRIRFEKGCVGMMTDLVESIEIERPLKAAPRPPSPPPSRKVPSLLMARAI